MTRAAPPLLEVDLGPGVRAAFTHVGPRRAAAGVQRDGGAEPGAAPGAPERGFNLSLALDDVPADVLARRLLLRRWAGAPVAYAHQVHGADVFVCSGPPDPARPDDPVADADALVAVGAEVAVAVLVADCVPVLLADAAAGVVAAVHAGRSGLVRGVVQEAVAAMVAAGAEPDRIRAAVGPAICGACYEVPVALQAEVASGVPGTASTTTWGTPALDLPTGVIGRLATVGVRDVQHLAVCTFTDTGWYSHRAAGGGAAGRPGGRFAGVVSLAPAPLRVSRQRARGTGLA